MSAPQNSEEHQIKFETELCLALAYLYDQKDISCPPHGHSLDERGSLHRQVARGAKEKKQQSGRSKGQACCERRPTPKGH